MLVYKGIKLAVVEAKSDQLAVSEGVAQAKQYAEKFSLQTTYATKTFEALIVFKAWVAGLQNPLHCIIKSIKIQGSSIGIC